MLYIDCVHTTAVNGVRIIVSLCLFVGSIVASQALQLQVLREMIVV